MKTLPTLIIALVCFSSGYAVSLISHSTTSPPPNFSIYENTTPANHLPNTRTRLNSEPPLAEGIPPASTFSLSEQANTNAISPSYSDSLDAILERLIELQETPGNGHLVAQQYDLLKNALTVNPQYADELLDLLYITPVTSDNFSIALSALRVLPTEDVDFALLAIAEQYEGLIEEPASREKYLALLSNTNNRIESTRTIRTLVAITELDNVDTANKLEALNLVQPYQLHETERQNVHRQLNTLLNNSPPEEAARLVPQLMRFSNTQQRANIANDMLTSNNSPAIRSAVLEGIGAGDIPATDTLKSMLLAISNNPDDELTDEAASLLAYTFDLTNQEYTLLQPKGAR